MRLPLILFGFQTEPLFIGRVRLLRLVFLDWELVETYLSEKTNICKQIAIDDKLN